MRIGNRLPVVPEFSSRADTIKKVEKQVHCNTPLKWLNIKRYEL
jgi:hypothetical protein